MTILVELIIASRPWSFTAAIVPVVVTAAVVGASFTSTTFFRTLIMAVCVQAGANLTNTYFDYVNGVDNKDSVNGEKTLVEKKIEPLLLFSTSLVFFAISLFSVLPNLMAANSNELIIIFISGILLSYFYTAKPVGLKYFALGDITIFICFGPLLMECASIMLVGSTNSSLLVYSVPVGLLTEAILHANNARDWKADKTAGITTVATLIGPKNSSLLYTALIIGSYLSIIYIAMFYRWGCVATLLTVPLSVKMCQDCQGGKLVGLPEETAKMHLPFGAMMLLGILSTSSGFLI